MAGNGEKMTKLIAAAGRFAAGIAVEAAAVALLIAIAWFISAIGF